MQKNLQETRLILKSKVFTDNPKGHAQIGSPKISSKADREFGKIHKPGKLAKMKTTKEKH